MAAAALGFALFSMAVSLAAYAQRQQGWKFGPGGWPDFFAYELKEHGSLVAGLAMVVAIKTALYAIAKHRVSALKLLAALAAVAALLAWVAVNVYQDRGYG